MELQNLCYWDRPDRADFAELAARYATPFFLYDADAVQRRINAIRDALDGQVKVFYAVKANPNLALLRAVREHADGLDISSGGELEQALLAGYDPGQLSFAGPAKTAQELGAAVEHGVGCISVESLHELEQCAAIAQDIGVAAQVALRVNPQLFNRSFGLKMGGKPIQFGIDEEQLDSALDRLQTHSKHLLFKGIHVYAGSQCFDAAGIIEGVQNTLRIARDIEARAGLVCKTINLGGGFGVSYGVQDRELDLTELAADLSPALSDFYTSSTEKPTLIFELGRYLTTDAGIYVARVISSKTSRGKHFVIVDGGLHHHLAAAGTFGAAMRANFPVRNLSRHDAPVVRCTIAGPSCNPTDLLGVDVELPKPEHGDLIAVMKSGSYSLTASPLLFLGRQTPAELVYANGQLSVGRCAKTMLDFN